MSMKEIRGPMTLTDSGMALLGTFDLGHATDTTISRKSAGVVQIEANEIYMQNGTDVAVADGGTGSSTAAGAATNLGLGTGNTPQFTGIEVGHANDTTVNRASAGDIQVEGNRIFRVGGADVPVADGGTGASDAATARANLGVAPDDGYTIIVKAANQDVTNAGLTNDSHFSFSVVAGGHYDVRMDLIVSGNNTTGDYMQDFAVDSSTMKGRGHCQNLTAAEAVQNIIVISNASSNTVSIVTGTPADLDALISVSIAFAFTAAATTTFRFRFGNSAAAAGRTSRTWKGSVMRWKRLD